MSGQAGGWEDRCLCCLESQWGGPSRAVRCWGGSGAKSSQLETQGTVPRLPRGCPEAPVPQRPVRRQRWQVHQPALPQREGVPARYLSGGGGDRSISDAVLLFSPAAPTCLLTLRGRAGFAEQTSSLTVASTVLCL